MKRLLVLFALITTALAAAPAPATHDFIDAGRFDWRALVAPPPADDSVAGRADFDVTVLLDRDRTPAQTALALHYDKFDPFILLADVLGRNCTAANLPRTKAFLDQSWAECRPVITAAKSAWNRPRPAIAHPDLHPVLEKSAGAAYPSGHAFSAAYLAVLFTAILPEHAGDWAKQQQLVGWSRLVGGAHYPSDVAAGNILGEAVGREMLKSPKMRQAIEEVRAELAAYLLKQAA
jgi:acid phosphatase (class A)